jgi:hypothetical protein
MAMTMECDTVWSVKRLPVFQRNVLLPSSGYNSTMTLTAAYPPETSIRFYQTTCYTSWKANYKKAKVVPVLNYLSTTP